MESKEKGWFKDKSEETLSPTIDVLTDTKEQDLLQQRDELRGIVHDLSEDTRAIIEKIDEKLKAPISFGPEKIEGSLPELQKELTATLQNVGAALKEYALLYPLFQKKALAFQAFSENFLKVVDELGKKTSTAIWEQATNDMGQELELLYVDLKDTEEESMPINLN